MLTTGLAVSKMHQGLWEEAETHLQQAVTKVSLLPTLLLSVSLCFDGATGAYEDKLMDKDHAGPFFLMYNIQFGKAVISFITLVAINQLSDFVKSLQNDIFVLLLLGVTGAIGQVFVFVTISKFGALNCALIGLFRKMLTLVLSFVLYGHTINAIQSVGLFLAIVAMIANEVFLFHGGVRLSKSVVSWILIYRRRKTVRGEDRGERCGERSFRIDSSLPQNHFQRLAKLADSGEYGRINSPSIVQ
jgi:uncharacterized membrane protein